MVPNVAQQNNRLETTRARPGQPAEGVILVDSRGLHAFCARPHTLLVLVPYISQSAVPVQQLLCVDSRIATVKQQARTEAKGWRSAAHWPFKRPKVPTVVCLQ